MSENSSIKDHLQQLATIKTEQKRLDATIKQLENDYQIQSHALYTYAISFEEISKHAIEHLQQKTEQYEKKRKELESIISPINNEVARLEDDFFEASSFSSKTITKYLACVLTERTGDTWLPIRYLLDKGGLHSRQQEAYAVISAESLFNLPHMGDTITLLKTPYYVSKSRYGIKYAEEQNKDKTHYTKIDDDAMNYIWQMSSCSFISIADTPKFNAFFNLNKHLDKPFLHIPVSNFEQKVLRSFDKYLRVYRNYDNPLLPDSHPRAIATQVLSELINDRLNQKTQTTAQLAQR